ncbi:LicD family protein [bacterium]|nr:LicD family protein [bacterium]
MLSTKNILIQITNSGKGKELSREELSKLQEHLFKMYRDIESVCARHGLNLCLAYGNVIGAMRHNGWIPWDDDLDIHMSREDYDLFLKKYAHELPPQYKVSSYLTEGGSYARFAKIIDTSTVHVPIGGEKTEDSGVFIDIFPIDNVPTGKFRNKLCRVWSLFMMYTATSVMQVEENSREWRDLMFSSKAGKANWRFRQAWGRVFSFASSRIWHRWIEQFAHNKKYTGMCHVMADLAVCYRQVPADFYFPFRQIDLPHIGKVYIPNKYDEYLSVSYGDWRKIPKDADKWHHYVRELFIPDEAE